MESNVPKTTDTLTENGEKVVYLITLNNEWARDLSDQLSYFNYVVKIFTQLDQLQETVKHSPPAALIIDIVLLNDSMKPWLDSIKLPIIFCSETHELTTHLEAIRHKGSAYFVKPTDVMRLAIQLDLLCDAKPAEPYRILIIEDTVSLAKTYAYILQQAGMQTTIVNDPLKVMKPLVEFKPDLILMDLYMPNCTGTELATIIRQQNIFTSIPIIYLSSEADKAKQITAMGFGAEDFLVKPIVPEDLITIVERRAQRARLLSSMISKDSLTGLLNHTTIQERLQVELLRAERTGSALVFAMLDLDHFKHINDEYGHQTGDLVITNLCRLLFKGLRRTDIAGRYGGEEFSLILPDTTLEKGEILCNRIRTSFSDSKLTHQGTEVTVTLSAGIAAYPTYKTVSEITKAADKALYEAKKTGRNRVVAAG